MGSDRARVSYDANQQYRAVVAQQGRITLESDWNEAQQIASEEQREQLLDMIGSRGTPDDGYRVIETKVSSLSFDFTVQKGTMYVGGVRTTLSDNIQYSNQAEWLDRTHDPVWVNPSTIQDQNLQNLQELVYLLLREQEVSAVEDPTLLDPALEGPDTTQRTRLIQRIVRLQTKKSSCEEAINDAKFHWMNKGLNFNPQTMRLESCARLHVSFVKSVAPPDPCDPEARGGYLGAENQLIRVQISFVRSGDAKNKLVWGFDNASDLYRVTCKDSTTLVLQSQPVDKNHQPKAGQVVEVLRSAAQLHNKEFIASTTGSVTTLATSYNPDTRTITLATSLSDEYQNSEESPLFLRVWQEEIEFTPNTAVELGKTGLQVTLQTSDDHPFHKGDYWYFAVRPSTSDQVYPKRYLNSNESQPPEGPKLWLCPLSVIQWSQKKLKVLEDCRQPFDDLVELTKRQSGGCCTYVVKPEDLRNGIALQEILDRFASINRHNRDHVTICLMPGIYYLPMSLVLGPEHSNFTLQGCGDGAELQAKPGNEKNFLHGLVVLNNANYVTFNNLRFQLPIVPFSDAGRLFSTDLKEKRPELDSNLKVAIGLRPLYCALLTVSNCLFRFSVERTDNLFSVGIFAGSECWGVKLTDNRFLHDEGHLLVDKGKRIRLLIGYLVCPSIKPKNYSSLTHVEEESTVPTLMQDVYIYGNRFTGLTSAVFIFSDLGTIRVENNTVFQCIFGFWLAANSKYAEDVIESEREVLPGILFLSLFFPLPSSFNTTELKQVSSPKLNRLLPVLYILANDIDTKFSSGSRIISGPGLVILLDNENPGSLILSANRILNHVPGPIQESISLNTTVLISGTEYCSITGNLIVNECPKSGYQNSILSNSLNLWEAGEMVVTGNILRGQPVNLPQKWEPFNQLL